MDLPAFLMRRIQSEQALPNSAMMQMALDIPEPFDGLEAADESGTQSVITPVAGDSPKLIVGIPIDTVFPEEFNHCIAGEFVEWDDSGGVPRFLETGGAWFSLLGRVTCTPADTGLESKILRLRRTW